MLPDSVGLEGSALTYKRSFGHLPWAGDTWNLLRLQAPPTVSFAACDGGTADNQHLGIVPSGIAGGLKRLYIRIHSLVVSFWTSRDDSLSKLCVRLPSRRSGVSSAPEATSFLYKVLFGGA